MCVSNSMHHDSVVVVTGGREIPAIIGDPNVQ
jgi:hypothetical protein